MLNVIAQEISSAVAASVPCICGSSVEAISNVVAYRLAARMTAPIIRYRRVGESDRANSLSVILS